MSARLINAQEAWGENLPDWVSVLIEECDQDSQSGVAKKLGVSGAAISQVLHNCYAGRIANVETVVRDTFMNAPVQCEALGKIESSTCLSWRRRAEGITSIHPIRTMMFRACRACPKFQKEGEQ